MHASDLITLGGLLLSAVIGLITVVANRRTSRQQNELGLIDQLQEELTRERQLRKDAENDLDAMRVQHNNSLDRIDQLLATGREQARTIAELREQTHGP